MIALAMLVAAASPDAAAAPLATLRWHKRVLLVSAPTPDDPLLAAQRRLLDRWRAGAADRDLLVVEIVGERVTGVADGAAALRRRGRLPANGFAVALIGKDGGIKLRARQPIPAATLEATIDAMPMRRAGQR